MADSSPAQPAAPKATRANPSRAVKRPRAPSPDSDVDLTTSADPSDATDGGQKNTYDEDHSSSDNSSEESSGSSYESKRTNKIKKRKLVDPSFRTLPPARIPIEPQLPASTDESFAGDYSLDEYDYSFERRQPQSGAVIHGASMRPMAQNKDNHAPAIMRSMLGNDRDFVSPATANNNLTFSSPLSTQTSNAYADHTVDPASTSNVSNQNAYTSTPDYTNIISNMRQDILRRNRETVLASKYLPIDPALFQTGSLKLTPQECASHNARLSDPKSRTVMALQGKVRAVSEREQRKPPCFLSLPDQIRDRIYHMLFKTEAPISIHTRKNFQRSAAFLRTCLQVYNEGRKVLYGKNSFHFQRSIEIRGRFWQEHWNEIGWKDIRSFLETIGDHNVADLKFVSFCFTDAIGEGTRYLSDEETRYVNDPTLYHIMRLIGRNATLRKFAVTFAGRRLIRAHDYHFLRSLTTIKSLDVIHAGTSGWHVSRDNYNVFRQVKKDMTVTSDDSEVDQARRKDANRKMAHDQPGRWDCSA